MKIAVTAQGTHLDAPVDPRFGRAAYILIVDMEGETVEALDNSENVNAFKGAGIQAAVMVGNSGAEVLLTGFCGPNAFKTLAAAGVNVANDASGSVRDALEAFKTGKMSFADSADVEGHW